MSRWRALVWLNEQQVLRKGEESAGWLRDALYVAAMTYVVAALSSVVMLVYPILQHKRQKKFLRGEDASPLCFI